MNIGPVTEIYSTPRKCLAWRVVSGGILDSFWQIGHERNDANAKPLTPGLLLIRCNKIGRLIVSKAALERNIAITTTNALGTVNTTALWPVDGVVSTWTYSV